MAKDAFEIMKDSQYIPKKYVKLNHPEWSGNATIYQVNIRQYTEQGTFKAFEKHLPRLKELGADILWLMPVNPIGAKKRKGQLGSYYSVKDYYAINPEFGSMKDFRGLVKKIHAMGMYVILDWVANHSAWDCNLVTEHPEWYSKTEEGAFQPTRWWDWDDVIDFDYQQPALRKYMTEVMKWWVSETDIDGYRCDVAGFIPVDFWDNVRTELDAIKPVFMLAEWESRDLHKKAFDMTYGWTLWNKMRDITTRNRPLHDLIHYIAEFENTFPEDAIKMNFIDNHDKNSWEGTPFQNFADGLPASMVLTVMLPGMPLVYNGQEAGLNKMLSFYEKDLIAWRNHPFSDLYKKLFFLKHNNQALWNGSRGGRMNRIINNKKDRVLSFYREKNTDKVIVIINYSPGPVEVQLAMEKHHGSYSDLFTQQEYAVAQMNTLSLQPWQYLVLVKF